MTRDLETYTNAALALTIILNSIIATAAIAGPVFTVTGDSMEPAINNPSIAYCTSVDNPETLDEGDIIGFENGDVNTLHRITDTASTPESTGTVTASGDNRSTKEIVPHDNIICEYQGHISLPI
ncbi:S24/S26 family peptidase [Halorubrum halodurans]|uniref:S24/S26 family peptidase n=1 Tax=Halorubrum halodurans TaxID=1383851 RepID=UPI00117ADA2A|nr:S24/S26 family peptidase [Halorubrum halodurans]